MKKLVFILLLLSGSVSAGYNDCGWPCGSNPQPPPPPKYVGGEL